MVEQKKDLTKSQETRRISELLKSQTNAEKQDGNSNSNGESIHEKYLNTPFFLRKYADTGWFATLGKHRITEEEPSKEALIERLEKRDWDLLLTIISTSVEEILLYKEELKTIPQG